MKAKTEAATIEELERKLKIEQEHGKVAWRVATAVAALAGIYTEGEGVYQLCEVRGIMGENQIPYVVANLFAK